MELPCSLGLFDKQLHTRELMSTSFSHCQSPFVNTDVLLDQRWTVSNLVKTNIFLKGHADGIHCRQYLVAM